MTQQSTDKVQNENTQAENTPKPKGWIRWSGLVSFLIVVGVGFAVTYLALTLVLKSQIEKYASQAWGAQISIDRLGFSFMPIGVDISGIEVTDPKKPMQNLVSIGHLGASLNFYQLVVGRTVIEDMSLEHLAFNQPRKTSGALVKVDKKAKEATKKEASKKDGGLAMPSMLVPKPEDILSRQTFKTSEQADKINEQLNQLNNKWDDLQKQMPNSQMLADYQKRFEGLTKGSINSLADLKAKQAEFEKLQKEVSKKADVIKQGKSLFDKDLPQLQKEVNALQKMPAKDFANLQSTYSLDQNGLQNFTYLIFGDKVRNYTQQGLALYEKVKPFIEKFAAERATAKKQEAAEKAKREMGQDIAFLERDPEPDFIIKRLRLSSDLDWGQVSASANDINFDQPKSRMATHFTVSVQPKTQATALSIKGQSNWIQPGKGFTEAKITWPDYQLKDWAMLKDDNLPLTMKSSNVAVNGKVTVTEAQRLKGVIDLDYQKVDFEMGTSKSKEVRQYLAPVFDDIHKFTVTSELSGKLFAPDIGARSDLDRLVSNSLNKVLNKQIADAKAQLRKQFDAQMAAQLKPINQKLASLLGDQVQLNSNAKSVDQILSVSPQQYVDQQKAKYEQQVKAQLEAEKKRMEAEAKKKAEEAAKKEKEKLQNQLLKQFKF